MPSVRRLAKELEKPPPRMDTGHGERSDQAADITSQHGHSVTTTPPRDA
ncbi:hypothetical protein [Streptomyces mirabilis]